MVILDGPGIVFSVVLFRHFYQASFVFVGVTALCEKRVKAFETKSILRVIWIDGMPTIYSKLVLIDISIKKAANGICTVDRSVLCHVYKILWTFERVTLLRLRGFMKGTPLRRIGVFVVDDVDVGACE